MLKSKTISNSIILRYLGINFLVTFVNEICLLCIYFLSVKKRTQQSSSELLNWNIHICSENNFPTAAGLASSAAGYACLVFALATLYNVEGDISAIARRGSGSACRSVYGGWVCIIKKPKIFRILEDIKRRPTNFK